MKKGKKALKDGEKRVKGFASEFKAFVLRGNVMDLAVGVIIGGAFQKIVNSLVNDVVMPLLGLIIGGIDFNNWFIVLGEGEFATAAEAAEAGVATLNYGSFISNTLNFLIMAFVIFVFIKLINKLTDAAKSLTAKETAEEAPAAPTTKICPFCKSEIPIDATKCAHCTSDVE